MKNFISINDILKMSTAGFISLTLFACSNTPNSISLSIAQGKCVQANQYTVTPPPAIVGNPVSAPYCEAVTIQNNNSGKNANGIQIINTGGLQVNYSVGATNYNGSMYDPLAAKITIPNFTQTIGNMSLYDPQNCVTTQGGNVTVINYGGGTCTFYLQLNAEAYAPGIYPIKLTYNYTNGNANYSTSTTLKQTTNLYAGGTQGIYYQNNNTWQNGLLNFSPTSAISSIIRDRYGNIYLAVSNQLWLYNGLNVTQIGSNLSSPINSIAIDQANNLYAATSNNGIYIYQKSNSTWSALTDNSGNITSTTAVIGLKAYEGFTTQNALFAITSNNIYRCNTLGATSCTFTAIPGPGTPTNFYQNALALDLGNTIYTGNSTATKSYSSSWVNYSFTPTITGQVLGVNWFNAGSSQFLYLSQVNAISTSENAAYGCSLNNGGTSCVPLKSSSGNQISGNAYTITTDGANNIYVTGGGLNSVDFAGTGPYAAVVASANGTTLTTKWTPITGNIIGYLQTAKIGSMLNY